MPRSVRRPSLFILVAFAQLWSGCTYTAAVSQTNIPANRSHPVEASVYKFIFFGTFDDDQAPTIVDKLHAKCPNGAVRGILVKDLRTYYFLFIFWAQNTIATGYCVSGHKTAGAGDSPQVTRLAPVDMDAAGGSLGDDL